MSTLNKILLTYLLTCVDDNMHCVHWAAIGECRANPAYMLVRCRKSCRMCYGGISLKT